MKLITIDGPSGAGKGSVAKLVASKLGLSLLDSGALYRITGLAATEAGVDLSDGEAIAAIVPSLKIEFKATESEVLEVFINDENRTLDVRGQRGADGASKVAVHTPVRDALLQMQRNFAVVPGLVADGRDMGTVVFPEAPVKVFLTASAEERARRRFLQLQSKGESVSMPRLLEEIQERDERDSNRAVAPLKPADDAVVIDSTALSIDDVVKQIIALAQ